MFERVAGGSEAASRAGPAARSAGSPAGTLTLLRHGESEWNRAGRFTGWADVGLTAAGEAEAARAGELLRAAGHAFDRCFTSALVRAIRSGEIVLRAMGLADVSVERSWRLNERHYGALQGLGAWGAVRRFGVLPVLRARRRYDCRPPILGTDPGGAPATSDARGAAGAWLAGRAAAGIGDPGAEDGTTPPAGESLADVRARVAPFWHERIAPELARGCSVLVVSHKHALRALFGLVAGRDGARSLRVTTGVPIVLTLDGALAVTEYRVLRLPPAR